jgi:[ribosomal protein S18]-alanine N-acetyltransferase
MPSRKPGDMLTAEDSIDIVPAGPEAAEVIADLQARAFDHPWGAPQLRRLIEAQASRTLLATQGYAHEPLGFVLAMIAVDEAEIVSIGVRPEHRRRGLGRMLVRALVDRLAEEGAVRLTLEVGVGNHAALALYRGLGFSPVGRRKGYYADGPAEPEDALVMELLLARA